VAEDQTSAANAPAGAQALPRQRVLELVRQLLDDGLSVRLEVTGSSMSPFVRGGDVVTLAPPGEGPIRRGEVVAVLARRHWLVIHRVVAASPAGLETRGDALDRPDEGVSRSDVVARLRRVERRGRRIRLGLGPERRVLAWLSRRGWLVPWLRPWRLLRRMGTNR
jgi:hypothetical protein